MRTVLTGLALGALCCTPNGRTSSDPPGPGRPFRVIAHRGASAHAPENTLPAFRRAVELGAEEVELDVQLSADDRLVLFHDDTLDAKTDLAGPVRAHTAGALRRANIGAWFDRTHPDSAARFDPTPLATLQELLAAFGRRLHYHVEIKSGEAALPPLLLETIERYGLGDRVTITSFHWEALERIRSLAPTIRVGSLVGAANDAALHTAVERAAQAGFAQVALPARALSAELVARAHAHGLEIRVWGVADLEDARRAIELGSNGLTTDWPERVLALLRELGRAP